MADVFHTFFGICGLLLLDHFKGSEYEEIFEKIDPTYALPCSVVQRLGLRAQVRENIEVIDQL